MAMSRAWHNVRRVLGRHGTLPVTVHLLEPIASRLAIARRWRMRPARRSPKRSLQVAAPLPYSRDTDELRFPENLSNQILRLPDERL